MASHPEIKYDDYPWDMVVDKVKEQLARGHTIYQKFTCEHCGNRLSIEEPNKLYTTGSCDQCGKITNIKARGCNFMLVIKHLRGNVH